MMTDKEFQDCSPRRFSDCKALVIDFVELKICLCPALSRTLSDFMQVHILKYRKEDLHAGSIFKSLYAESLKISAQNAL